MQLHLYDNVGCNPFSSLPQGNCSYALSSISGSSVTQLLWLGPWLHNTLLSA
jgi:hypothetical protein